MIGAFIALGYYKSRARKAFYLISGFIFAISLHTVFNFFIIQGEGTEIFTVFSLLWVSVIILLLILFLVGLRFIFLGVRCLAGGFFFRFSRRSIRWRRSISWRRWR